MANLVDNVICDVGVVRVKEKQIEKVATERKRERERAFHNQEFLVFVSFTVNSS